MRLGATRWVEQDPMQILTTVQTCMKQAAMQLEHKGYVPQRDVKGPRRAEPGLLRAGR